MKNNPFQNLISDASENGNLAGDFLAMAKLDIIAAECLECVLTHPNGHLTVEACVANYLAGNAVESGQGGIHGIRTMVKDLA